MKMLSTAFIGFIAVLSIVVAGIHFLVPNTRSGIHSVVLKGSLEEVWAVYTDPASLPDWRGSVLEIVGPEGETGSRQWTEVSEQNVRIAFQETVFDAPRRYGLNTSSDGYFTGHYLAEFEQIEPLVIRGTFTETITTESLKSKILALLFVRPKHLIEGFARDAQAEIDRRSQG